MSDARALVIGGGPAGLMAAEAMARAGLSVMVAEAKPSLARKLLMAGKSGLNLTKDETLETFLSAFGARAAMLEPMLDRFGPQEAIGWAEALGQEMFTGPTGRVFPKAMKASPLLRAWLGRLDGLGVSVRTRWRWTGWDGAEAVFQTPDGARKIASKVTILALGGASWARLGSDGAWADTLEGEGVELAPFQPANMGFCVGWSDKMRARFGAPVKGVAWHAGAKMSRGEAVISERGLEGGGIYAVSPAVRDGAALHVDLAPDVAADLLEQRLSRSRGKMSVSNFLRKFARLSPEQMALLMEFGRPLPEGPRALAGLIKSLPVRHDGPRPMDEAISVAGGVRFDAVTPGFELRARPGVFVCGEMLDWEAPTGGYLLTACLATGLWAGEHAAQIALPARKGAV
ncbi:TIGR03862 family flavoprotein [Primorskyibacter aestuariivivens]|uniref:TIGR03862 family flavoprotein n=1 Tax=Primorskyibacter aestuariivivens TaxID=1888912 RepID=UPI002300A3E5|nr:TIGR03862 family flavoprotein [Primorskyibacter aestuariivivens]MDA7428332.1 TIGR03862 family flavoprotein [Primorskyibacter aestuariivivens]